MDNDISVILLSETWLNDMNNDVTAVVKTNGYNIIHVPRSCSDKTRGGGVAIVYRKSLTFTQVFIKSGSTFESVSAKFKDASGQNVCCTSIYRSGLLNDQFFSEFDEFLGSIFLKFTKLLVCGDFNIHLDNTQAPVTVKFQELISSYGLAQLIKQPTHRHGHTLDAVLCSHQVVTKDSAHISLVDSEVFTTCDHFPILFDLCSVPHRSADEKKVITFRSIKNIDPVSFSNDLASALCSIDADSFAEKMDTFEQSCNNVIEYHAPLITKTIKDRRSAPWFDGEYKALRVQRRKAERCWKKSNIAKDKELFLALRDDCSNLAMEKKKVFYRSEFTKHNYSSKSLFRFVDTFLDKEEGLTLPPSDSIKEVVNNFNDFFATKIKNIRSKFPDEGGERDRTSSFTGKVLDSFSPASEEEILSILKETELKTSSLDPLPASLIKDNLDVLLSPLCELVNASLSSGNIDGAKLAHITPLIKGKSLDHTDFKNYRPISNLSFIGKLIERVVLKRLNNHMLVNNLHMHQQSGYKKNHSTETLLVRIVNDLLIASTESKATVVMLLDLSAAFDTVDHNLLLSILEKEVGITGIALKWFRSFLNGRCQKIRISGEESHEIIILFGVPQGSVLGPVLFNIYIRSLYSKTQAQKFAIQGYADDHQVYKSFKSLDEYSMLAHEVPRCFQEISKWMTDHYLALNPGKTEVIVFGSPGVLTQLSIKGVFLNDDVCIRLSPVVKNLGFRLDNQLNFSFQVAQVKKGCFNRLRQIARMKRFLTESQLKRLVEAIVLSSIDYCNALYFGCNSTVISQLQLIQNRACRVIFGMRRRESVHEKMKSLHWLKVQERITFKMLLLVYKSFHGIAPPYLNELLHRNQSSSSRRESVHIPSTVSNPRAFELIGPKLWYKLPQFIRECDTIVDFKKKLKTYLFTSSYQ